MALSLPRLLAAATLLAALAPSSAHAFCRSWSCDPVQEKKPCPADPQNTACTQGGDPTRHKPLFWPQKCIGFSVNQKASAKIDPDPARARAKLARIADLSFATWQKADCGQGKRPSLSFTDLGFVECNEQEFNGYSDKNPERPTAQGNANLITFRDTWPAQYKSSGNALALTTLTFSVRTGEIYDADIEINGEINVTTNDTGVVNDLQSILTHEVGHFLGLGHSTADDATMFAQYTEGSTSLRDLSGDDISGICAIYPPNREGLPACDPTPRHGYSTTCAVDSPEPSSCSTSPRARLAPAAGAALLVASAAALRLRRRRR